MSTEESIDATRMRVLVPVQEFKNMEKQKDDAYAQRNRLVRLLTLVFPSYLARHEESDVTWENDWRWIVFISLPKGDGKHDQISFHIHDSELVEFNHLHTMPNVYDGHTDSEKWRRIRSYFPEDAWWEKQP